MKNRDKLLTFITACIPGVGYMYNGLMTRGIEALGLFIFISLIFDFIGLHFIGFIVKCVFWLYTFIDTYRIVDKIHRGETVLDSDFIFEKHFENGNFKVSFGNSEVSNTKAWTYIGWGLIIVGCISVFNKLLHGSELLNFIKFNIDKYSIPVLLIVFGLFILFRKK